MEDEIINSNEDVVVIDVASIPNGWDVNKLFEVMNKHGVLLYDSFKGGDKPYMLQPRKKLKFMLKDIQDGGEVKE